MHYKMLTVECDVLIVVVHLQGHIKEFGSILFIAINAGSVFSVAMCFLMFLFVLHGMYKFHTLYTGLLK